MKFKKNTFNVSQLLIGLYFCCISCENKNEIESVSIEISELTESHWFGVYMNVSPAMAMYDKYENLLGTNDLWEFQDECVKDNSII